MTSSPLPQKPLARVQKFFNPRSLGLQMFGAIIFGLVLAEMWNWASTWPSDWIVPLKRWLTEFFTWIEKDASFGLFTAKDLTRALAWYLKQPLIWSEYLLWKGAKPFAFLPVFWILLTAAVSIFTYYRHGLKAAIWVGVAILGVVIIDALPVIHGGFVKALRTDPWVETQAITGISQLPGYLIDAIIPGKKLKAIPWITVVLGFAIFGHWVGGWRLATITGLCMGYLAVTGLWRESMKTFSLVVVAVPISALIGLWLGVWVTRSKRAASILSPMFDVMQATPHLAYLVPVVVLFGAGQVPALIATVIFAMPPMARCTILGLNTVPSDIIESGRMSGCTQRQLLWKVELPASQKTLLLGLNQVIMQTLAMVVIASLVGAAGLGHKLLFSLQQLKLGFATMQGVAIVLMAIVLDRLTQAYATRATIYEHLEDQSFYKKHIHMIVFAIVLVISIIAALYWRNVSILTRDYLLITSKDALELDKVIKAVTFELIDYIRPIRDFLTVYVLIPIRDFYQSVPWVVTIGLLGVISYRLGGWALTALNSSLLLVTILFIGNWGFATTTFYFVSSALVICVLIGVPLGIWSARSPRVAKIVMFACDTLQTFPSFIYLLPAIMLFRVGELAIIFAIIPYATVPAIRYTYLGLKRVPEVTIEAAKMSGATRSQSLWKVELPIALPEIMLGVNQTIMMALAMTAITALIGGQDLGQEIYRALPTSDVGRGVMAGLGIATLGIIADRLFSAWAKKRNAAMGMD